MGNCSIPISGHGAFSLPFFYHNTASNFQTTCSNIPSSPFFCNHTPWKSYLFQLPWQTDNIFHDKRCCRQVSSDLHSISRMVRRRTLLGPESRSCRAPRSSAVRDRKSAGKNVVIDNTLSRKNINPSTSRNGYTRKVQSLSGHTRSCLASSYNAQWFAFQRVGSQTGKAKSHFPRFGLEFTFV